MTALTSPYPDVTVPNVPLHEYVLARASEWGDRPALIDGISGKTITYAQLAGMVSKLAAGFATLGLKKGDVVAMFSPNTILFPVVAYAVSKAGGTITTLNSLYTPDEIAKQLADSKARYFVTIAAFLDRTTAAIAKSPVEEVFVCDAAEGYRSVMDLLALGGEVPDVAIDPAEDILALPYSSGTTGVAKGVMLTHSSVVANLVQVAYVMPFPEGTRLLAVLPFFHIYGMVVLMHLGLASGATVVTLPKFDLEQFLATIQTYKITYGFVAPPVVLALAKHPMIDKFDLSSLEYLLSGAAPLDSELAAACAKRIGVPVGQGYGMTELSPVSHLVTPARAATSGGTVGELIAGTKARLVNPETGADVAPGEVGELWINGPQKMKGYLGRPDATAEMITPDGWLRTGDMALVDAHGNYTIVERLKELIKYKGYQVPPAELEALLLTNPKIADAAVIGVRDEEGEEIPKAFVVVAAGAELTAAEVIEWVEERIAPHKKVRRVEFIAAIPKSAAGKILRKDLRARQA